MSIGIGIIGCGNVFPAYMRGLAQYDEVRVVRCSDIIPERARDGAAAYGIPRWGSNEDLFADSDVEIVVNLTPVVEHVGVSRAALEAGKHVYTEKVIAMTSAEAHDLVRFAAQQNLTIGSATDTFLGTWGATAKHLVEENVVGDLVAASACFAHNRVEVRHPEPEPFFQPGGGPLFELGPYFISALVHLLGPVAEVSGKTRIGAPVREVKTPGRVGDRIPVEIPTHSTALLTFETGVIATAVITFDVWASEFPHRIELYGVDGTISVPHPNWYDGDVKFARRPDGWDDKWEIAPSIGSAPAAAPRELVRGPGVLDLARSLEGGRHQTSGQLATHVLDVLLAIQESSDTGDVLKIASPAAQSQNL